MIIRLGNDWINLNNIDLVQEEECYVYMHGKRFQFTRNAMDELTRVLNARLTKELKNPLNREE